MWRILRKPTIRKGFGHDVQSMDTSTLPRKVSSSFFFGIQFVFTRRCSLRGGGVHIYTESDAPNLADAFRSFFDPNATSPTPGVLLLNIGGWFNLQTVAKKENLANDAMQVIATLRRRKQHRGRERMESSGIRDPCADYNHSAHVRDIKGVNHPYRCECAQPEPPHMQVLIIPCLCPRCSRLVRCQRVSE